MVIDMAKGKYHEWLEPDKLILLQGWARDGLSNEQMAHNMGINEKTFYEWIKRFPQISKAVKKGKEVIDYAVENALLKKAISGDVTAMIFWLKNRKPKQWNEKIEQVIKGELGIKIIDDIEEDE